MSRLILRTKLPDLRKGKGRTKIISLMGVRSGVGVTHTTMLMANCLRRQRLRVAVVEMNSSGHYEAVEAAFEGVGFDPSLTDSFRIKGVHYFKRSSIKELFKLCQKGFDVILMDIGSDVDAFTNELQNMDHQLIVGRMTDWKRSEINTFRIRHPQWVDEGSKWVLPMSGTQEEKDFQRQFSGKAFALGFAPDPFVKYRDIDEQIIRVFE